MAEQWHSEMLNDPLGIIEIMNILLNVSPDGAFKDNVCTVERKDLKRKRREEVMAVINTCSTHQKKKARVSYRK